MENVFLDIIPRPFQEMECTLDFFLPVAHQPPKLWALPVPPGLHRSRSWRKAEWRFRPSATNALRGDNDLWCQCHNTLFWSSIRLTQNKLERLTDIRHRRLRSGITLASASLGLGPATAVVTGWEKMVGKTFFRSNLKFSSQVKYTFLPRECSFGRAGEWQAIRKKACRGQTLQLIFSAASVTKKNKLNDIDTA